MPTPKSKPGPPKPRGKPGRPASPRPLAPPAAEEPRRSTMELVYDVLQYPEEWLRTPNHQFGNRRPIDLLGTDEEEKVRDLLRAADAGIFG